MAFERAIDQGEDDDYGTLTRTVTFKVVLVFIINQSFDALCCSSHSTSHGDGAVEVPQLPAQPQAPP